MLIYTSTSLSEAERAQLENLGTIVIRKEDVSTRLSAVPFLDWLAKTGVSPEENVSEQNV